MKNSPGEFSLQMQRFRHSALAENSSYLPYSSEYLAALLVTHQC
jgi:hypothetical protein